MAPVENERKNDEAAPQSEMTTVAASDARDLLTELLNRAAYSGERIGITKNGKLWGAIIGPADLARLEGNAA